MAEASIFTPRALDTNLRAALETHSGRPIGLAKAPVENNGKPDYPYAILYPLPGGTFSGSLDQPTEDAQAEYQVTIVAETPDSVRWLHARIRKYFLERQTAGAYVHTINAGVGWAVHYRSLSLIGGLVPEGKELFNLAERYMLDITRA